MHKKALVSQKVSKPVSIFSQALEITNPNKMIYLAGMTSRDINGKVFGAGDITLQTETIFKNMEHVLAESGATLKDVIRLTIYVTDIKLWAEVHAVRAKYFSNEPCPVSSFIEISNLFEPEHLIEIEGIAAI